MARAISRLFFLILATTVLCVTGTPKLRAEAPRVVASILPVHSLAAGVMAGVGTPALLVRGAGSPHTYTLRPSEAKALQDADVVFWIGEEMEAFLEKPLRALSGDARTVALHEVPGVTLLEGHDHGHRDGDDKHGHEEHGHDDHGQEEHGRDNHGHEEHGHDDHGHQENEDHHRHGAYDMHIWLDPANARAMTAAMAATLAAADPAGAARYQANAQALDQRLAALDAELAETLAPVGGRAYIVFHEAYAYVENRYGLTQAGSITVSPERRPSAAKLAEIREAIARTGATCVFAEPQFEPAVIATVVEGTGARTGILDPLGANLTPGPDAYFTLMRALAASLKACLERSS